MEETLSRSSHCFTSSSNSTAFSSSRKRKTTDYDCGVQSKKKHPSNSSEDDFKLPVFSPDVQQSINNDAFYTTTQRNRLIKESCVALRGYCWQKGNPISNNNKRELAKTLCGLAPKSLGDPESGKSTPEVRRVIKQC